MRQILNFATIAISTMTVCASNPVFAKSSINMFGVVDAALSYKNNNGNSGGAWGLTNGANTTSRLGFRGSEDLGGGLKIGFWLEGAINVDSGGGASATTGFDFKRESTIRISGNFGEFRLGREITPSYRAVTSKYDVFGQVGIGRNEASTADWTKSTTTPDTTAIRQSNMISYYSPRINGFVVSGGYGFDEDISGSEGRYKGIATSYDNDGISLGLSYERRDINKSGESTQDKLSLGGSYNFNNLKLLGFLQQHQQNIKGNSELKFNTYAIGLAYSVGPGQLRMQYTLYDQKAIDAKAHHLSLGYVYSLSKSTAIYGTLSHIKNQKASNMGLNAGVGSKPGAGNSQSGMQLGIRKSF